MLESQTSNFHRSYDLIKARQHPSHKQPEAHQSAALNKLGEWFERTSNPEVGGILVLPTGGGKTYTAVRFLCANPISKDFKVLWLAHTHHLLEQALDSFKDSLHTIIEPKKHLNLRVVSGAPEHFSVSEILPSDDVIIATLQTITNAYTRRHPALMNFLAASDGKLCVVFDEAHHSPAPSYAKFLMDLRQGYTNMRLLGLTATPLYTTERKQGWLAKLFPQKIIYDVSARKLIAARILAKPVSETYATDVSPDFDEREYQKWIDTYQDLPEDIITTLAENRERNAMIANTYKQHRERYGKTIMFADRWYQCEQLEALLEAHGVRAGSVYSHVGGEQASVAKRNKRDKGFNAKVLDKFKKNELDVLLNVRMLTEGTDVPKVNTVFLTRQTTSQILLTQMVGRALRGPKFGGTEEAFIVAFTDRWKQQINWAEYDALTDGKPDETEIRKYERPPLQLISIDLVRRLTRQMDSGVNINAASFVSLMPLGWYIAEFQAIVEGSDDIKSVSEPVMIFEHEHGCYQSFIAYLQRQDLESLASENLKFSDVETEISEWQSRCFSADDNATPTESLDVRKNLFLLMRHLAQNDKIEPRFFLFKEREQHDLDAIAAKSLADRLDRRSEEQNLRFEYHRTDRFWRTIYPSFGFFSSQYDGCVRRILDVETGNTSIVEPSYKPGAIVDIELSEADKQQVKKRDGYACLCCGETKKGRLTIDHIVAAYYGINNSLDNLQTLCKICNSHKSINELNFRINKNDAVKSPRVVFPDFARPKAYLAGEPEEWEKYLRRNINFFYRCAAVESIRIGRKGVYFYEWQINLYKGNSPAWLKPHLENLVKRISIARTTEGFQPLQGISIKSPNEPETSHFAPHTSEYENANLLERIANGTSCRFRYQDRIVQGKILKGNLVIARLGTFATFSAASQAVTGKPRNGWKDWELLFPKHRSG